MKILYIAVHSHIGWGAEYWLNQAFNDVGITTKLLDYRKIRQTSGKEALKKAIKEASQDVDLILLQRGDKLSPGYFADCTCPLVFWSTEPLQLKTDVDNLLNSNIFSWVFVHLYSCVERVENEFHHLCPITSVMHNAVAKSLITTEHPKSHFAIFNRNVSWRRKKWLKPARNMISVIKGRYGDDYYQDLRSSQIAVNIHYSKKSLDDFESGIFEAMACGCAVVSEQLPSQTIQDLNMHDAMIQVDSPKALRAVLTELHNDPEEIQRLQRRSKQAIINNTWHQRAIQMKQKFAELCQ